MIKAIIFDCYGVLMTMDYVQQFAHNFATTPEIRQRFEELHREVDLGLISRQEFIAQLSSLSGVPIKDIIKDFDYKRPANKKLLEYIATDLKPKYKIGLLSNVGSDGIKRNFSNEEMALFDDMVLSYEVGMAKPDPAIFELACQRLNVQPSEAIMIDDLESNCRGAEEAGLIALQFSSDPLLHKELKRIID